jgi:hypothetical protein
MGAAVAGTSGETIEPGDSPVAARALEWAAAWYPKAHLAVSGVTEATAAVLVEVDGDIRIVHYENLDAKQPRCEICRRPL